jgi:hypothetical protein
MSIVLWPSLKKTYYKYFQRILKEPEPVYDESPQQILDMYNIRIENAGESMENIIKIYHLKKYHPDIALFVQTSPAFCYPSLITQAMANRIERITHTPSSRLPTMALAVIKMKSSPLTWRSPGKIRTQKHSRPTSHL